MRCKSSNITKDGSVILCILEYEDVKKVSVATREVLRWTPTRDQIAVGPRQLRW